MVIIKLIKPNIFMDKEYIKNVITFIYNIFNKIEKDKIKEKNIIDKCISTIKEDLKIIDKLNTIKILDDENRKKSHDELLKKIEPRIDYICELLLRYKNKRNIIIVNFFRTNLNDIFNVIISLDVYVRLLPEFYNLEPIP